MHRLLILFLSLALTGSVFAVDLNLPSIFGDHMVLQRERSVPVWGTADSGADIEVSFGGQSVRGHANAEGHWRVNLGPIQASKKSRALTVTASLEGEQTVQRFEDVLVGEVWLCGGQSNMYRPFRMLVGKPKDMKYEPIAAYLREEAATANDTLLRQYRVGKEFGPLGQRVVGRGNWSKAVPGDVNEFSGTAYFFARELRRELDVPVAILSSNLGGTLIEAWIPPRAYGSDPLLQAYYDDEIAEHKEKVALWDEAAERAEYERQLAAWKLAQDKGENAGREPRRPEHPSRSRSVPGTLYCGMVQPLAPYAIRGAIWYQGESNSGHFPKEYGRRLEALIKGWREAWGQDRMHFFWCQLANYKAANDEPLDDEEGWTWVQDGQRQPLALADTGMAVLNDVGDASDVHPKNKVDAGKRLSRWALHQAYGRELVPSGPLFHEANVESGKVMLTFKHVGSGLMVGQKHLMDPAVEVDEPLRRFQILGPSGQWDWAQAEIVGSDRVAVWHPDIAEPVEVRYAWSPNPEGANLYNREGLPASLFRTESLLPTE